jgi:predicted nucleotidyltransferase
MATRKKTAITLFPDFKEFIELLNSEGVRYLMLGGYAVNLYGHHRSTQDIDLWISADQANAERMVRVYRRFGYTSPRLDATWFTEPGRVNVIGRAPVRIDLLTGPSGVDFEACYPRRVVIKLDGIDVDVISLADLRVNKSASGRPKDLLDLKSLPEA